MSSKLKIAALLLFAAGCGPNGPAMHKAKGKIELEGGDVSHLAGSTIEAALETDTTIRASGEIQPDGSFTLETLHEGNIVKGAHAGTFQVRLILTDDDKETRRRAAKAISPRFLKFDTSGLSFQVPAKEEIVLKVQGR